MWPEPCRIGQRSVLSPNQFHRQPLSIGLMCVFLFPTANDARSFCTRQLGSMPSYDSFYRKYVNLFLFLFLHQLVPASSLGARWNDQPQLARLEKAGGSGPEGRGKHATPHQTTSPLPPFAPSHSPLLLPFLCFCCVGPELVGGESNRYEVLVRCFPTLEYILRTACTRFGNAYYTLRTASCVVRTVRSTA